MKNGSDSSSILGSMDQVHPSLLEQPTELSMKTSPRKDVGERYCVMETYLINDVNK